MISDAETTIGEEVNQVRVERPHVIVLGAGASRATCLNGDKNGRKLPLMDDFIEVVGLKDKLENWGIDPNQNFEEIFSDLYEKDDNEKIEEIQKIVETYFDELELPDTPTIYDHLILSLRNKDLIATFNWDPLLIHAYLRNSKAGLSLPKLVFLHGNVRIGYCEKDKVSSLAGIRCKRCGTIYKRTPLLYPIKKKDYAANSFIANEWKLLKWGFENAFMITIFGYSGPRADQEAIEAMKKAWGDKEQRSLEQTTFITNQTEDEICKTWEPFIHTHHYDIYSDFYNSWIAKHPRRTGEAWMNQYIDAKFISDNSIPRNLDFNDLWKWYERFKVAEKNDKKNEK